MGFLFLPLDPGSFLPRNETRQLPCVPGDLEAQDTGASSTCHTIQYQITRSWRELHLRWSLMDVGSDLCRDAVIGRDFKI